MKTENSITVVFLMYVPFEINLFHSFIDSYIKHPGGINHKLLIVFKGINNDLSKIDSYTLVLKNANIQFEYLVYEGGGYDIDAYFFAANKCYSDFYYFINTNSILLADNWLLNSFNKAQDAAIGVVASTASNQSYYSTVFKNNSWKWDQDLSLVENYRKYKLLLKAFFYWRFLFKPFPNPHFRTNAFLIRRDLLMKVKKGNLPSKFKAYQFESGRYGFTNQVLKMGFKILVIDKSGNTFEQSEWKQSKTFWIDDQEGLVVSDNQTAIFKNANVEEKNRLTNLAWGK